MYNQRENIQYGCSLPGNEEALEIILLQNRQRTLIILHGDYKAEKVLRHASRDRRSIVHCEANDKHRLRMHATHAITRYGLLRPRTPEN